MFLDRNSYSLKFPLFYFQMSTFKWQLFDKNKMITLTEKNCATGENCLDKYSKMHNNNVNYILNATKSAPQAKIC